MATFEERARAAGANAFEQERSLSEADDAYGEEEGHSPREDATEIGGGLNGLRATWARYWRIGWHDAMGCQVLKTARELDRLLRPF